VWSVVVAVSVGASGCALEEADETDEIGSVDRAVIGGEETDPGAYPATGALVRGRHYRCTATLIAPDVAITAAHCLIDQGFGDFGFTLDADLTDEMRDLIPVVTYHRHPQFEEHGDGDELSGTARRNDIAVLILERPIDDVPVEVLAAPGEAAEIASGSEVTLCGYGRDQWSVPETAGLKRDATLWVEHATEWELATEADGPQACKGDSGGPLFVDTPDGRRIAGLVSRAAGETNMCNTGAIYTRVSSYIEWVEQASLDRDTGCSAGGSRGGALPVLLACVLLACLRHRRM
jgi:secreted trypsin-like serine protease